MEKKVKGIINDMKETMKFLNEAYIFNDEEDMGEDPRMMQGHDEMGEDPRDMEDDDKGVNLAQRDERIVQMRELALQGLQDYADDVANPFYDFYKKVWLETDKMCDNKDVKN